MKHLIGFPNLSESYFQKKNLLVVTKPNRIVIFFFLSVKRGSEKYQNHSQIPKKPQGLACVGSLKQKWIPPRQISHKSRFKSLATATATTCLVFCSFPFGNF